MARIINANTVKSGNAVVIDGNACIVKNIDISKTGKHGHAKCRIEAEGIADGKKRVIVVPGHERFEVPEIDKRKCQILTVSGNKANVMDLETYETFDMEIPDELKENAKPESQIEYWIVQENKIAKRVVG